MKRKKVKNQKRIKRRRKNLSLVAVVVMLLCGVIAYKKVDLNAKSLEYKERIEKLEEQKEKEEARKEDIAEYKKYVQSKEYIEEQAREKLGLVYPGEIIFEPEE